MTRVGWIPYTRVPADTFARILLLQNNMWGRAEIYRQLLKDGRRFYWSPYDQEATTTNSIVKTAPDGSLWVVRLERDEIYRGVDWDITPAPFEEDYP